LKKIVESTEAYSVAADEKRRLEILLESIQEQKRMRVEDSPPESPLPLGPMDRSFYRVLSHFPSSIPSSPLNQCHLGHATHHPTMANGPIASFRKRSFAETDSVLSTSFFTGQRIAPQHPQPSALHMHTSSSIRRPDVLATSSFLNPFVDYNRCVPSSMSMMNYQPQLGSRASRPMVMSASCKQDLAIEDSMAEILAAHTLSSFELSKLNTSPSKSFDHKTSSVPSLASILN
jgi:hypothetical protein